LQVINSHSQTLARLFSAAIALAAAEGVDQSPVTPLVLTMIPLGELLDRFLHVVFESVSKNETENLLICSMRSCDHVLHDLAAGRLQWNPCRSLAGTTCLCLCHGNRQC
jgi:hypothetical protein